MPTPTLRHDAHTFVPLSRVAFSTVKKKMEAGISQSFFGLVSNVVLLLLSLTALVGCEPTPGVRMTDSGVFFPDVDTETGTDSGTAQVLGLNTLASGLSIDSVSAFQTLEVPLDDGTPAATRMIPLLTNKDMVIRIGVSAEPSFAAQMIRAVASVDGRDFEQVMLVSGSSTPSSPSSFFTLRLDAAAITPSATLRIRLLGEGEGVPDQMGNSATWPTTAQASPIGAVESPRLKLTFIEVNHPAGGEDGSYDLTPERLESMRQSILAAYPVSPDKLETNIRPGTYELTTLSTSVCSEIFEGVETPLTCFPDFELHDEITALHESDGAPGDVIYVAIYSFNGDNLSGLGGLGTINARADLLANTGFRMIAIATFPASLDESTGHAASELESALAITEFDGTTGEGIRLEFANWTRAQGFHTTLWHEIGHTLSLGHLNYSAMFSNYDAGDTDPEFPRALARVGRAGYDMRHDLYIPADLAYDFMSCGRFTWVSDANYRALFDVLSATTPARTVF